MYKSTVYSTDSTFEWVRSSGELFTRLVSIFFGHWEFYPSTQQMSIDRFRYGRGGNGLLLVG